MKSKDINRLGIPEIEINTITNFDLVKTLTPTDLADILMCPAELYGIGCYDMSYTWLGFDTKPNCSICVLKWLQKDFTDWRKR